MKYFEISETDANAILRYLTARPYAEVFQGVHVLQGLKCVREEGEPGKDMAVTLPEPDGGVV